MDLKSSRPAAFILHMQMVILFAITFISFANGLLVLHKTVSDIIDPLFINLQHLNDLIGRFIGSFTFFLLGALFILLAQDLYKNHWASLSGFAAWPQRRLENQVMKKVLVLFAAILGLQFLRSLFVWSDENHLLMILAFAFVVLLIKLFSHYL